MSSYKLASFRGRSFVDSPLPARYNPLAYSCVAQRQSIRLLTGGLLVRIQPQELFAQNFTIGPNTYNAEEFLSMLQFEQRKNAEALPLSMMDAVST